MTDILLNYAMPIEKISTFKPDLSFLHNALVIVKPKAEVEPQTEIKECLSQEEVSALTDAKCFEAVSAGMSSIYVLATNSLDITGVTNLDSFQYFTILIDEAFTNEEVTARNFGDFKGVISYVSDQRDFIRDMNLEEWGAGFYSKEKNGGVNMYHAFGKLLSSFSWKNQQYIEMPKSDGIITLNEAKVAFNDKINFVLLSPRYGNRLALFSAGGGAIVAPYLYEEITNNIQSWGVQYINLNNPQYTTRDAKLMQEFIQSKLNVIYVNKGLVPSVDCVIEVVEGSNFVAKGGVKIGEPKALWRVETTVQQGEI